MTANIPNNAPLVPGAAATSPTRVWPADIEQVDAFVRKLYKRARAAGPDLEEIATTVRSLHTVLKHLKFEAEDPESLLCVDGSAVYARQLTPILEDSEFALKQLDTILEKKYGGGDGGTQMDGEKGWTMLESRERDMIELIRTKLANQKLSIDMFLDTIQLRNPSKSRRMVDTSSADLDSIKDKVDVIASRICQRKNSNLADGNEEDLWEKFRDELERAGFSRDVLRKNQDVIRAYIRQLDEQLSAYGGSTPSVRGLLEHYHPQGHDGLQIAPYPTCPTYPTSDELSPEELHSGIDEEKLFPSMRMKRLEGENDNQRAPPLPSMSNHPTYLSYDRHSSSGDNDENAMAFMSTRELMALDKQAAETALAMGNLHLQSPGPSTDLVGPNYHMSTSPTLHHLPPSASQPALPSSSQATNGTVLEQSMTHPRYVPSLLMSGGGSQQQALTAPQQRNARLAPDSHGREIPLEAKWTRISRQLVSPEVLASAGVRYEARPDFVAILGELSRDQIADFACRTTEVRGARRRRSDTAIPITTVAAGNGVKGKRTEDRYHPDKYRNWDVIEEEQRQRPRRKGDDRNGHGSDDDDGGVTYVVNSRGRHRKGSTTSSVSALYDSSDDERTSDSDVGSGDDDRDNYGSPSYSQSYPRSSSHLDDYHNSQPQNLRRSSTTPSTSSKQDDKARSRARDKSDSNAAKKPGGEDNHTNGNEKGTKAYPFIVPPPSANGKDKNKEGGAGTSPAATIMPKPILKNKNDDPHVRIDPTPQIIDEGSSSVPRSLPSYRRSERERREKSRDRERDRDRTRDKDRDRERDRDHDRDREKRYRSDRYLDRERDRERHPDRERDRDRDRDRDRGDRQHKDKEYYSHRDDGREEHSDRHRHRSHSRRYHGDGSSSTTRRNRERDYYDDHYVSGSSRPKEDRTSKKKARDETIRAVSLGGAAAAMLSMLSEAAL
ncbi:hypothetical protein F4804DRAFT_303714 [Jackrogersella minutella]|nr:hypothetical protein F4804DRAFT_303714 [Jackrogersella minutella]